MQKIILGLILITLFISGCGREEIDQKKLIKEYVENNKKELVNVLGEINFEEKLNKKEIISKLPKGIKILDVYNVNDTCIEFDIGGGIVTPSHYYGFYYTLQDKPLAAGIEDKRLQESGNGYKIQEEGNEDWYYTEKITDNFYFYEDHY